MNAYNKDERIDPNKTSCNANDKSLAFFQGRRRRMEIRQHCLEYSTLSFLYQIHAQFPNSSFVNDHRLFFQSKLREIKLSPITVIFRFSETLYSI